ncbi:MAG: GNAT family N-acetyltransferase [Rhodoferax sp.]
MGVPAVGLSASGAAARQGREGAGGAAAEPAVARAALRLALADYASAVDAQALVHLLDQYARDPMGGGEPLGAHARAHLVAELARQPQAFSVLAWAPQPDGPERAVGLANCFEGFSTFACRPLVNVHDLAVDPAWRGQGVGQALLAFVLEQARARGACKLTLEVLSGNHGAQALYRRCGFALYQLDPAMGQAQFWQKLL